MPKMPDITQAQIAAAVTWVVGQVVAWGWINNNVGQQIVAASATAIALVWTLADSYLRGKRNEHAAAVKLAEVVNGGAKLP